MGDNDLNPTPEDLPIHQTVGSGSPPLPPKNGKSRALMYLEKIRLWWFTHPITPFNGVSRIHYYEARERYYSLMDLVRYQGKLRGLDFPDFEHDKNFEYPKDLKKIDDFIRDNAKFDAEEKERCFALLTCYESLIVSRNSLTRRQGDLNQLWRTMTRVRSRIIRIIVSDEMQASQLYFCQEEAIRLGVDNDPSIKSMVQDLAEAIDSKGATAPSPKYNCVLNALIERFNSIRTDRIHQQFVNVRTYLKALGMLMLISFILILNHDLIMSLQNNPPGAITMNNQEKAPANPDNPADQEKAEKGLADGEGQAVAGVDGQEVSLVSSQKQGMVNFFGSIFKFMKETLQQNMFAFVFFGGLTGGFFSVATRARPPDRKPGEDVYYSVYVLSKPFIGALGAIILYILIQANFVTPLILEAKMIQYLGHPGTMAFGFAFIAGFSERIVFPQFR